MSLIDPMIEELRLEGVSTRKVLERIPDDKWDWRPDPKSMTFGRLASHIVEGLKWAAYILERDEFVIDTKTFKPEAGRSKTELLEAFDTDLAAALEIMKGQSDENMMKTWTFKVDGHTVFKMPKAAVLRTMILSHQLHHRGQMTVYLRLNGVALPAIYGPTADERGS